MSIKTLILKIENSRILFTPSLFVDIRNSNIPYNSLTFRTNREIYWEVEITNTINETKTLNVLVKDYNFTDKNRFERQFPDIPVERIIFEKFDWTKLDPLLIRYYQNRLKEIAYNFPEIESGNTKSSFSRQSYNGVFPMQLSQAISNPRPKITDTEFWISFDNLKFEAGYISFMKKFEGISEPQLIKIFNEHVLAEFENIKSWFARKLKIKKIKVYAKITFGSIPEIEASSPHIDLITPDLIENISYARIDQLTKELNGVSPDKSVYSSDEMFELLRDENEEGNIFKQTEEDILNYFIEKKEVRNKKQLAFLSDKKQSTNFKLRYTLHPFFGFLFFVEGSFKNHFVWEMLNSNATYVWSIDKAQADSQFDKVDKIINSIRANGRKNYKRYYNNRTDVAEYVFYLVRHDDIATKEIEGYLKWENRIDELLN